MRAGHDRTEAVIAGFPYLCAWIHELQAGTDFKEAVRILEKVVTAIVVSKLRRSGIRDGDDIEDCRNKVLMLVEKRLREPMEFNIAAVTSSQDSSWQLAEKAHVLQLLRPEPFTLGVCHPDLRKSETFHARFRDVGDGSEVVSALDLSCAEDGRVSIRLPYDTFRHEQVAVMQLSQNGSAGLSYGVVIQARRRDSFENRMRFVTATAGNVARESVRPWRNERELRVDDPKGVRLVPTQGHEARQHVYRLLAKRAIAELPRSLYDQIVAHHIDNRSWAEIAAAYGISEAKARQDVSRALSALAAQIVACEPEAKNGAVQRVVQWLKDMLPYLVERA